MKTVRALGYRVIVKLKEIEKKEEKKSSGGILLEVVTKSKHQMEQEAVTEAIVVDIGPSAFKAFDDGTPWCKVGDKVLISKYSGRLIENTSDDKNIYRLINDEDLLAKFED